MMRFRYEISFVQDHTDSVRISVMVHIVDLILIFSIFTKSYLPKPRFSDLKPPDNNTFP